MNTNLKHILIHVGADEEAKAQFNRQRAGHFLNVAKIYIDARDNRYISETTFTLSKAAVYILKSKANEYAAEILERVYSIIC